ncbi:transmembrane protein, putative (macronuclear) [Tetrahymena thermophila SB210]|uniref:Transmembrane protein, putative n=1 Tax=Tetrahymena thermophila (strain SB210) TaxID=312017 RepID=Q23UA5_TETTS|nr:transmembrane protein, putative [Tetrahymena thermophila SB210]EAS00160.1 transmembrane protein, putative [Tetrahymena thermophila SB210]|eukprot:XP_001020405.1 transmembrane protein, putative [Tetrahymena thermophila SB210]
MSVDQTKKDYKYLKQDENQEYTLLYNSVDEERGLLHSVNELILIQAKDISHQSSCDQSIQMSSSHLDGEFIKKESTEQQILEKNKSEQKENLEQSRGEYAEQILYKYTNKIMDLFKWNREYSSLGQLYFQITFDGLALYYINKQIKQYKQQMILSNENQQIVRDCISNLSNFPDSYFYKAKQDSKVVVRGQINDPLAINCINNKILDKRFNVELSQMFKISSNKNLNGREINCKLDKNLSYQNSSKLSHSGSKMNLFTSFNAGIVSLFTGYAFKSEIKFDQFQAGKDFYFFGQRQIMPDNTALLNITNIFKEFDLQKFRVEEAAYLISILVSYGVGLYLAVKIVKNVVSWVKNKNKNNK